jgi:hypothetical protein
VTEEECDYPQCLAIKSSLHFTGHIQHLFSFSEFINIHFSFKEKCSTSVIFFQTDSLCALNNYTTEYSEGDRKSRYKELSAEIKKTWSLKTKWTK